MEIINKFIFFPEKICYIKKHCIFAAESERNLILLMHKLIISHFTEKT